MDTFDIINLSVFLLFLLPVIARLTFWKRGGQLLRLRSSLAPLLLCAIGVLSLSANHHWGAPHRRAYQLALAESAVAVSLGQLAVTLYTQWQEAARKKARRAASRS